MTRNAETVAAVRATVAPCQRPLPVIFRTLREGIPAAASAVVEVCSRISGERMTRAEFRRSPMIQNIDHIGIAVRSIAAATKYYEEALGLTCERVEEVPSQKVRTAFFSVGGIHLELLEPSAPDSPISGFLEKRGEGVHHVAFATDNIDAQLASARDAGVRLIHETPFEGAADKLAAFLHPKSTFGVLTEVCASKSKGTAPAR